MCPARSPGAHLALLQFTPERDVWLEPLQLKYDYPLIGGSPLFPNISCEAKRDICIVTTGEAEINAAATSESHRFFSAAKTSQLTMRQSA